MRSSLAFLVISYCLFTLSFTLNAQDTRYRIGLHTGYYYIRLPASFTKIEQGSFSRTTRSNVQSTVYRTPGIQIEAAAKLLEDLDISIQLGYQSGQDEELVFTGNRLVNGQIERHEYYDPRWARAYWGQIMFDYPILQSRFEKGLTLGTGVSRLAYRFEHLSILAINNNDLVDHTQTTYKQGSDWAIPIRLSYQEFLTDKLSFIATIQHTTFVKENSQTSLTAGLYYHW